MDIPWKTLSKSALRGLIEEFVSREGTEYGGVAVEMSAKREQVQLQLERGEAQINFDPETDTTDIVIDRERVGQRIPKGGVVA